MTPSDRLKHQTDLVFLLALLASSPGAVIDAAAADCSKRDRKRLRLAIEPVVADRTHRARSFAPNFGDVEAVVATILD